MNHVCFFNCSVCALWVWVGELVRHLMCLFLVYDYNGAIWWVNVWCPPASAPSVELRPMRSCQGAIWSICLYAHPCTIVIMVGFRVRCCIFEKWQSRCCCTMYCVCTCSVWGLSYAALVYCAVWTYVIFVESGWPLGKWGAIHWFLVERILIKLGVVIVAWMPGALKVFSYL